MPIRSAKVINMSALWSGCLNCQEKSCCRLDIAYPLFVTEEEMKRIRKLCPDKAEVFNKALPCPFLLENGLCMIHQDKPVDCRLFPFDVIKIDGKFTWIVWKFDCYILGDNGRFEEYLSDIEERLIPGFVPYLEAYSSFRLEELFSKHDYKVLREIRLKPVLNSNISLQTGQECPVYRG